MIIFDVRFMSIQPFPIWVKHCALQRFLSSQLCTHRQTTDNFIAKLQRRWRLRRRVIDILCWNFGLQAWNDCAFDLILLAFSTHFLGRLKSSLAQTKSPKLWAQIHTLVFRFGIPWNSFFIYRFHVVVSQPVLDRLVARWSVEYDVICCGHSENKTNHRNKNELNSDGNQWNVEQYKQIVVDWFK